MISGDSSTGSGNDWGGSKGRRVGGLGVSLLPGAGVNRSDLVTFLPRASGETTLPDHHPPGHSGP